MQIRRPRHATVVAYLALAVAATGTASAATGGNFLLGKSNSATATTKLTNSAGTALALRSKSGTAPFSVSSSTKISKLNSDLLDGLDSSAFQRRISSACSAGSVMSGVGANGAPQCVAQPSPTLETQVIVDSNMSNLGGYAVCPVGWSILGGGFDRGMGVADDQTVMISKPVAEYFGQEAWYVLVDDPSPPYQATGKIWAVCGRLA